RSTCGSTPTRPATSPMRKNNLAGSSKADLVITSLRGALRNVHVGQPHSCRWPARSVEGQASERRSFTPAGRYSFGISLGTSAGGAGATGVVPAGSGDEIGAAGATTAVFAIGALVVSALSPSLSSSSS